MTQAVAEATTGCCIVGGGPAGMMLGLLLARAGVDVTVLEMHHDFERDFRGDTVHPSTLEVLDQLGLADAALRIPHSELREIAFATPQGQSTIASFAGIRSRFPYIALLPQARFLDFLAAEGAKLTAFHLVLGATVTDLLRSGGRVVGVRYATSDGDRDLRTPLVVGADGRFSKVRHLAGIEPRKTAAPMDVLWFRLPRHANEGGGVGGRFGGGHILVQLERGEEWQMGLVIAKGSYGELHAAGLEALRSAIVTLAPDFADRVPLLTDWHQVSLLSVESSRCDTWHAPGLLLIGDAAHVMSPVGGVGINYAVQDAVVAANTLFQPLLAGEVPDRLLAQVQRRRELPTRFIQAVQWGIQQQVIAGALDSNRVFQLPWPLRLPGVRSLPARLFAFGLWPPRVGPPLLAAMAARRGAAA